jgi:hypothetical protein
MLDDFPIRSPRTCSGLIPAKSLFHFIDTITAAFLFRNCRGTCDPTYDRHDAGRIRRTGMRES